MISVWNPQEQKDDTQVHKSAIQFVVWDHDSSRFATGDQDGVVALWKLSKHNGLTLLYTYTPPRSSPATHCVFWRKTALHLPWVSFGGGRLLHALWTDDKGSPPPPSSPHKGLVTIDLTHQAQGPLAALHQSTSEDELLVVTSHPNAILMTFRCSLPLSLERTSLRIVSPSPPPTVPSTATSPSSPAASPPLSPLTTAPSSPTVSPTAAPSTAAGGAGNEMVLCWAGDELVVADPSNSSLSVWSASNNTSPSVTLSTKSMMLIFYIYWDLFLVLFLLLLFGIC
jgi:hypothetical protein